MIDLFNREVVGYSMDDNYAAEQYTSRAFRLSLARRSDVRVDSSQQPDDGIRECAICGRRDNCADEVLAELGLADGDAR